MKFVKLKVKTQHGVVEANARRPVGYDDWTDSKRIDWSYAAARFLGLVRVEIQDEFFKSDLELADGDTPAT